MKKAILCILLLLVTSGVCAAADIEVYSGFNFNWWNDNRSNDGRQLYIPLRIDGRYKDFSATVLTAFADTHISTPEGSAALSDFVDTKLNTSYALIGRLPVDILLGLDFNLPSGKTDLDARQLPVIMDPDLVAITNFGEGVDVNPTVTFAKEWKRWVAGVSLGYLWRGSYDFSSDIGADDYQPGDIYSMNMQVRYYFTPTAYAKVFGKHAWYGTDTIRGEDFYHQGDFSLFGFGVDYLKKKSWEAGATFTGILRDKSRLEDASGILPNETVDIWGDEYVLDLVGRWFYDDRTVFRGLLQGRYFTENGYPEDSQLFMGARQKLLFGVGMTRNLSPHVDIGVDAKGFVKHDDRTNFAVTRASRDIQGVEATLLVAGSF